MLTAELKGRDALMRRLDQLAPNVEKYAAEAKMQIAKDAAEAITAAAPRGEAGEYASSIKAGLAKEGSGVIGITATKDETATAVFANYIWRFLEFGTRAHQIKARNGGRLKFRASNGAVVAVDSVKHPGSAAQPHVFTTWRAMKKKSRRKLLAAVNKAVREAMGKS